MLKLQYVEKATPADVVNELDSALLSMREIEADLRGAELLAEQCSDCSKVRAAITTIFDALEVPRAAIRQAIETCLQPGRPLILIVEDALSVQNLLRQALEEKGYNVIIARDGRFAFEFVRLFTPALILLDLMMPGLDGPAFLRAMEQARLPLPPVVVLTALEKQAAASWLAQVGRTDLSILTKPFHLPELLTVVAEHVDVPQNP